MRWMIQIPPQYNSICIECLVANARMQICMRTRGKHMLSILACTLVCTQASVADIHICFSQAVAQKCFRYVHKCLLDSYNPWRFFFTADYNIIGFVHFVLSYEACLDFALVLLSCFPKLVGLH